MLCFAVQGLSNIDIPTISGHYMTNDFIYAARAL